jgi:hypothetical protein
MANKTKGSWPADTPRDITAMTWWPSNAEMMYDLVRIGYVDPRRKIVDLTYGRGTWWTMLRAEGHKLRGLVEHDVSIDGVDFRQQLPHRARSAHTVTFDPPYVSTGGRTTSTPRVQRPLRCAVRRAHPNWAGAADQPRHPGIERILNQGQAHR